MAAMKGHVTEVYKIYDARDRELIIPVYQRNYDWTPSQCRRLLSDLVDLVKSGRPKHFFGAVVGKAEGAFAWVVIDGQQRLTTVSILMLALSVLIEKQEVLEGEGFTPELSEKIRNNYLLGDSAGQKPKFKLKPVKDDAEAYRRLFGPDSEFINSSNLTANYLFFAEEIPKTGLTAVELWNAICRLEVMHLDLESHDDPQRIFESLNSTGLALSEADKVRNLVLMGLDSAEQIRVYEEYWNRIEKNVSYETDAFLRWYLVTKTSRTPRLDRIYEDFKVFASESGDHGAELLGEVREYSEYYRQLLAAETGVPGADKRLNRLNILKQDVVLPLLMPLLAEVRKQSASEHDFASSVEIIESYLFRRFVCGYATHGLNKIFASLYKEVSRLRGETNGFSEVLAYALKRRTGTGTFPKDDDFAEHFAARDFYNIQRPRRQYLFECLENHKSNDSRDIADALSRGDISVEHIMPQTLNKAWASELGEASESLHREWLNRIGNLTVTGYNSTYSNRAFLEKRDVEHGFCDSPYRINSLLKSVSTWGEQELTTRTKSLTDIALSYWEYPQSNYQPPRAEHPSEPLGNDTNFTGREVVAFEFSSVSRVVKSWRDLLIEVLRECVALDRASVFAFARANQSLFEVDDFFAGQRNRLVEVVPGLKISIYACPSTDQKAAVLRRLLEHMGIDTDELSLKFRRDETDAAAHGHEGKGEPPASQHARLFAFIERFEVLAELDAPPESSEATIRQFAEAFKLFSVEDPAVVLGGPAAVFARDGESVATASKEQVLALFSAKVLETNMMDPLAFHQAVIDGTATTWLRRLHNLDRTPGTPQ